VTIRACGFHKHIKKEDIRMAGAAYMPFLIIADDDYESSYYLAEKLYYHNQWSAYIRILTAILKEEIIKGSRYEQEINSMIDMATTLRSKNTAVLGGEWYGGPYGNHERGQLPINMENYIKEVDVADGVLYQK
jgi:hypothetical protein